MTLLLATLAGFVAAPLGGWIGARPRVAGPLLAAVPAALTIFFLLQVGEVLDGRPRIERLAWVPSLGVDLVFQLDGLSLLFALLVTGVGALVLLYSGGYASPTEGQRLFSLLLAFMASMLGLVLAGNLLLLYLFWALTSLTSYVLIGFHAADVRSRSSAQQALLVTVAGELAMLGGFVLLGQAAGTYSIAELPALADRIQANPLFPAILVLILAGALTKSAQAPFHFWLPNAMAAPTPVSAYLHSVTMVQAGVFLLARLHPALGGNLLWHGLLVAAALATIAIGAVLSLGARDMKRILAYSTVAALGVLVLLLGLGTESSIVAAVVFLVGHAFYKAALFLVVGAVDHEIHERSVDEVAGLRRTMPLTAAAAALAALSMAGLPPFFGFISKELVYEAAFATMPMEELPFALATIAGTFISGVAFVAVALIVGVRPFLGRPSAAAERAHGETWLLWLPTLVLAVLGLAVGVAPALFATGVVTSAVEAIAGERLPVHLVLWHGLTPILALSAITVAIGALIFVAARPVRGWVARLDRGTMVGPERGYGGLLRALSAIAVASTRALQNGNLRHYVLTTLATAVVLVGLALVRGGRLPSVVMTTDVRLHELTAAGLIVVAAVVATLASSRLTAIAALGIVGYGVALLFLLFGAPDLAMTQILIETLTLVIFLLVFYHLPGFLTISRARVRLRDATVSIGAGTMMGLLVLAAYGDGTTATISGYFIETAGPIAHARNVVNAILVDYRALDTLGEITVLALAGLGVIALLRLRPVR